MADERPSDERVFDQFLLKGQRREALGWLLAELEKRPTNQHLYGFAAFSCMTLRFDKAARKFAQIALRQNPFNKWALTVDFAYTPNSDIEEMPIFFTREGFYLEAIWVLRFDRLGLLEPARRMWGFIARYGPESEKWSLLVSEYGVDRRGGLNS